MTIPALREPAARSSVIANSKYIELQIVDQNARETLNHIMPTVIPQNMVNASVLEFQLPISMLIRDMIPKFIIEAIITSF